MSFGMSPIQRCMDTGIAIGEMLYSIFKEFGIAAKVQNVVTDNAANFTKAFSLYHRNTDELTLTVTRK